MKSMDRKPFEIEKKSNNSFIQKAINNYNRYAPNNFFHTMYSGQHFIEPVPEPDPVPEPEPEPVPEPVSEPDVLPTLVTGPSSYQPGPSSFQPGLSVFIKMPNCV